MIETQLPPLGIAHQEQFPLGVIEEAQGLAGGQDDALELPLGAELQLPPVAPMPGELGLVDPQPAVADAGGGKMLWVVAELEVNHPAVALAQAVAVTVWLEAQVVAVAPAVAQGACVLAVAVVVALEEQAQGAGQRGQVDFLLVFVAGDHMDRVTGVAAGNAGILCGGAVC
ncbi:hypothetical protein CODIS_41880 [Candidatus Thiodiazotropha endolucinida]|uniref:Uncharacterized protein n=1 Tax=Candidatus Thiodiazotropha endolucinida TaxID=1655433 RepID=A0A7Z0VHD7_9GAMM|nr:hypothetical protein CODIS_41880 [Candidatus Thiodiazotropha endolucinida]